ncbi:MAG: hypothetical protein O3C21_08860 [Verrucomicrobia bacterium]|nr:hypothetical protein [Verrucomicrobiota bacterium]
MSLYSEPFRWVPSISFLEDALPDDWMLQPSRFVDLNAPIILPGGEHFSPIVDPALFTGSLRMDALDCPEGLSTTKGLPERSWGKVCRCLCSGPTFSATERLPTSARMGAFCGTHIRKRTRSSDATHSG